MIVMTVAPTASNIEGWGQVSELLLAFVLCSTIGLERNFHGKSAGLRTHAIVGTSSALVMLVSKYGFDDVVSNHLVTLDPSRVAAQIVSGIGFLGAGLIIRQRGAIRGLTTAASVWETAAIGMAAGANLPLLATAVSALHFIIVFGFTALSDLVTRRGHAERTYTISYDDGQGVLRDLLSTCTERSWTVKSLTVIDDPQEPPAQRAIRNGQLVTVVLTLTGTAVAAAQNELGCIPGVVLMETGGDDD